MTSTEYMFYTKKGNYRIEITKDTFKIGVETHKIRFAKADYYSLDNGWAGASFKITGNKGHYVISGSGVPVISEIHGTLVKIKPLETQDIQNIQESQNNYVLLLGGLAIVLIASLIYCRNSC